MVESHIVDRCIIYSFQYTREHEFLYHVTYNISSVISKAVTLLTSLLRNFRSIFAFHKEKPINVQNNEI